MNLKNLSIKEIIYKLQSKGIDKNDLEDYLSNHKEKLNEYEIESAKRIYSKKINTMEEYEIKQYLKKKGYSEDSIRECSDNL